MEIFAIKNEIIGLPPSTLNTIEKLALALNNNPDFFNYVNQQLLLKRNIIDSYDKNYINNLITNYYNKTEIDNNLLLKQDQISVLSLPGQIGLLNGNLIKPLQSGNNVTITDAGTHVVISSTAQSSSTDNNFFLFIYWILRNNWTRK